VRVLTLTNTYPPHYYGGYELTCHDVMRRWAAAGHDVTVLTSTVRVPGVADVDEPHVRRTLRAYWDWERNTRVLPRSPVARLRVEQHNLRELAAALEAARPDVVSVWHLGGLSLSLLTDLERRGLPLVLTVANEWLERGVPLDGWARLWRWLPLRPRAVGGVPTRLPRLDDASFDFVSEFTKGKSMRARLPWRFADAPIISPGIDLDDFPLDPSPSRPDWGWRVLYVGRIDPPKGVETLVRAFALMPPHARLELVGGGDVGYQRHLRGLAAELGVADRLTLHSLPRAQVRDRCLDNDVLVFPSEWEEPFGLVPLEAMACALPVVATGKGGSGEFLRHDDNCLLYGVADPAALAAAVTSLADDAELRRRLVAAGLATARDYTAERYAAELLRLHEQAAGTGVAG
jgi:glycosyltransferase involved in cell wall biosynthesis